MNRSDISVGITRHALEQIENESRLARYAETGGVVAGIRNMRLGGVIITHASQPGPMAKASRFSFQHDRNYCQGYLDELASRSNGRIDYLGEWHKHFERNPEPSNIDLQTLTKIALDKNYHVSFPLLLIIGSSNLPDSLKVWVVDKAGHRHSIAWNTCDEPELGSILTPISQTNSDI